MRDGVPHHREARRPPPEPVVATAAVGGVAVAAHLVERFAERQQVRDQRMRQGAREGVEPGLVARRLRTAGGGEGDQPAAVLDREDHARPPGTGTRSRLDRHRGEAGRRLGRADQQGRVDEPAVDALLYHLGEAEPRQPVGCPRAPPGGVHHQVRGEFTAVRPRPAPYPYAGHPAGVADQPLAVDSLEELDRGIGEHPGADDPVQEVPTEAPTVGGLAGPGKPAVRGERHQVTGQGEAAGPGGGEGVGEPGQQRLQTRRPRSHQQVSVPGLGQTGPRDRAGGQPVPVDHDDLLRVAGEHRSCEHAREATAQDDGTAHRRTARPVRGSLRPFVRRAFDRALGPA